MVMSLWPRFFAHPVDKFDAKSLVNSTHCLKFQWRAACTQLCRQSQPYSYTHCSYGILAVIQAFCVSVTIEIMLVT